MTWEWITAHALEALYGIISAGMLAGIKVVSGKLKKLKADNEAQRAQMDAENKAMKEGLQALLRDRVISSYDKYIAREYILVRELENVEAMYSAYHALGGNGTITRLVEELRRLPHSKAAE